MSNDIQFDIILDKIIDVTERNLSMQSEFLKAIYELKGRFDTADRDHKEMAEGVKVITSNSFDILNSMKAASNEKIIEFLEHARDNDTNTSHKFKTFSADIVKLLSDIKDTQGSYSSLQKEVSLASKDIKEIADKDRWIKRILGLIALLTIGFQIIFGMYLTFKKDNMFEELKQEIIQLSDKNIKK